MCLDRGRKPSLSEFKDRVHKRNLDHLTIWHNVGADVENGYWAIIGARTGTFMTMLTDWDYREVQWFDFLENLWLRTVEGRLSDATDFVNEYAKPLATQLDLPVCTFNEAQSKFFKQHYRSNWKNIGPTVRE
jgi:hypothetical protein